MDLQKTGKFFNFKNKYWEIQFARWNYDGASNDYGIDCYWRSKCDHAGFQLRLDFWQFMFNFQIYDCRHWDDEADCYEGSNRLPETKQEYDMPPCKEPKIDE
jgi:hypothetical protein